ncbi:MAG: hypothetical protein SPI30_08585 [Prevotella sp.]|nr:hypothetical protein [Prevotella sp.]
MRKLILGMAVLMMGLFMVSCTSSDPMEKAKSIVEEIKANGAEWDAAKWKSKMLEFAEQVKVVTASLKEAQNDPAKLADAMKHMQAIAPMMQEIQTVAQSCKGGQALEKDADFQQQFMKALGATE